MNKTLEEQVDEMGFDGIEPVPTTRQAMITALTQAEARGVKAGLQKVRDLLTGTTK